MQLPINLAKDLDRCCWIGITSELIESEIVSGSLAAIKNMFPRPTNLRVGRPQVRPMLCMFCAESMRYHFMLLLVSNTMRKWRQSNLSILSIPQEKRQLLITPTSSTIYLGRTPNISSTLHFRLYLRAFNVTGRPEGQ